MVNETLYSIIFLDNERNPIPNCYFELTINGHVITGQANNYGEVQFNRQLVESTPTEYKELNLTFWNEKFPKTEHSTTDSFVWPEGKTSIKALMPDTYIINTRSILNEDDEPQEYQRAYYLVRKGDTWSDLEAKLGINKVEALMFYNRMEYSDQLVEGTKLYYPLGFRTKKEKTEKGEKTNSSSTKQQRSQENGKPIEVASKRGGCFCYRDFTVDEVKNIIKLMRDSEKDNNYKIFFAKNCPLSESDKTYERLTEEINKTFRKYEINTCLRKVHFLAQMYLETDRLKTTVEYASGERYNPGRNKNAIKNKNTEVSDGPRYKGRGGMQLTWRVNYLRYFEHTRKDVAYYSKVISPTETLLSMSDRRKNFNTLVGESLFLAIDSAGWYWRNGSAWGNLNNPADNDDIYKINIGVNGGFNDFKSRISWVKLLIKEYNINECKNLRLNKELGVYRLSDSSLSKTKYGKEHEKEFKEYDE